MARDVNGTYARVSNSFTVPVTGTPISPTDADAFWDELDTEITDSLSRSGKGGMSADLDMNNNDINEVKTAVFQGSTSGNTTLKATAIAGTTELTLPAVTDTLATLAGTEELTNKTLNAAVGKGTWTASGTWTLPAFTFGGTVSGGGQQLNNVIIGTATPLAGSFTTVSASGLITAAGGQIAFPATQNPSANANTLDDYEEGTWTPAYTYATPGDLSVAYSTQVGVYTKIGRLVIASFVIVTSTHTFTTASGNNQITGLTFTSANVTSQNAYGAASWDGITKATYTDIVARLAANSATIDFVASGSAVSASVVTAANCATGTQQTRTGTIFYVV